VELAGDDEIGAEHRALQRVGGESREPIGALVVHTCFDSAPHCAFHVLEMPFTPERAAADEDDVVSRGGVVRRHAPAHAAQHAARAAFPRARDDLIERRIGQERVGQTTRILRVRTGQFDRRGHSRGLGVASVEIDQPHRLEGHAGGRIQPRKAMVAVQGRADLIAQIDVRPVEPGGSGQREARRR
jgi:hypothetical protein